MNNSDKYMLLASLSFFFACLAISLISLHDTGAPGSYIYTPPQIEPEQKEPLGAAARQYGGLPKSVLHYSPDDGADQSRVVTCFLEDEYKNVVARKSYDGAKLTATAAMGTDRVEVYAFADGAFSVYVIGPDALGQQEACEVAAGTGWTAVP